MKAFLSKFIPFFAGVSAFSLIGMGPNSSVNFDLSDILVWIFRSFIALCIATIAYFLKGMMDERKAADDKRDKRLDECDDNYKDLIKVTAAHEVMYLIWIEDLANNNIPANGNRKTDQVRRLIQSLAEDKPK